MAVGIGARGLCECGRLFNASMGHNCCSACRFGRLTADPDPPPDGYDSAGVARVMERALACEEAGIIPAWQRVETRRGVRYRIGGLSLKFEDFDIYVARSLRLHRQQKEALRRHELAVQRFVGPCSNFAPPPNPLIDRHLEDQLARSGLSARALSVYLLLRRCDRAQGGFPTQAALATAAGIPRRSLLRCLAKLEASGYIKRRRRRREPCEYDFPLDVPLLAHQS